MNGKILIIDSSPELRALFAQFLESQGYETAEARDGETGITYLAENPAPNLVLLDSEMDSMSGADFLAELGRRRPGILEGLPVIALSGASVFSHPKVVCSLRKPLDLGRLETAISSCMCREPGRAGL